MFIETHGIKQNNVICRNAYYGCSKILWLFQNSYCQDYLGTVKYNHLKTDFHLCAQVIKKLYLFKTGFYLRSYFI